MNGKEEEEEEEEEDEDEKEYQPSGCFVATWEVRLMHKWGKMAGLNEKMIKGFYLTQIGVEEG